MGLYQIEAARKEKRKATQRAEAAVIAAYGRLKNVEELDVVLNEKLANHPAERADIRAYVQTLVPHLRDIVH